MTTEDKDNAITPDYIDTLINQIASRNTAKSNSAYYDLQDIAEDVAEAYLKLHEENMHLKQKLLDERGCDVDGCSAHIKAFSEENARLRKVIELINMNGNYASNVDLHRIARDVLKESKE